MNRITQDMRYRLSMVNYAQKHGVTKAAIKYRTNRQYIYRWAGRYDGTLQSLAYRSRRPHSHPQQHTEHELKLISDMRRRNPQLGLVIFWVKLRQRGYSRTVSSLFRVMRRMGLFKQKKKKKSYKAKTFEKMSYPGQRVQIDVKHVPKSCLVGMAKGQKYYQYTAIDEFSRLRYIESFPELSTYSSTLFLTNLIKFFPFPIECVQTDNGLEFTNRLRGEGIHLSLFEKELVKQGIRHKLIRPATPRHNGKVERSHRTDNERFYSIRTFYSLVDLQEQQKQYLKASNAFPMSPLNWKSPIEVIREFFAPV